ncbi:MAG: subtilisin-like proprotein convertase family protein [Kiritimatiellia bacterium]|jgi:subtilisin-like proprotein convertase family protein
MYRKLTVLRTSITCMVFLGCHLTACNAAADMVSFEAPLPPDDAAVTSASPWTHQASTREQPPAPSIDGNPVVPPANLLIPGNWISQGPGPINFGQTENVSPNNEVAGAAHAVAAHPTIADILYVGAVNGGIWKTTNATAASPTWSTTSDDMGSASIGALTFDPNDATLNTLWAGVGRYSSFSRQGGQRIGLLRTTNGGTSWTNVDGGGTLVGKNISGLVVRGNTIVVSVDIADTFSFPNIGIFRSTNGGASFTQIGSGSGAGTGLPGGLCHDLAPDPTNLNVLYTTVVYADFVAGLNGLYKSTDLGATWTKVSNATMDAVLVSGATGNVEISVGNAGQVYAGIILNGQLRQGGVFWSTTGNVGTWNAMDIPLVNEAGGTVGTNPRFKKAAGIPGGQGSIHFSIVADPTNANVVYVGGDRQPRGFNDEGSFPNALGADNYTGRLFRGDRSVSPTGGAPSPQWKHLTHTQDAAGMTGGGTANNSAPHADSRDMAFDANGNIIEVDDGGVYRRTSPGNNSGDWFSINGNLQITEAHSVKYDTLSNVIISGNQDTGSSQQSATGAALWTTINQGDGGDVAIAPDPSNAAQSLRYSSPQYLGDNYLRRQVVNAAGTIISTTFPSRTPLGGDPVMSGQFYTPLEASTINGNRLLFGGGNGVYESLDGGSTISRVSTDVVNSSRGNPMVYGGRSGGSDNADLIYVAVDSDVKARTAAAGALTSVGGYTGGAVVGLIADYEDWMTLFVIDGDQVFRSTDTGANFTDITGNLPNLVLHSIDFIRDGVRSAVFVGTDQGVFVATNTDFTQWDMLGSGLPDAPVWDMDYDPIDDVLVATALGRGVWKFNNAISIFPAAASFTLDISSGVQTICAPSDATYTVDVASIGGFTDPVTLSASGHPAGTTLSFSPNPVTPGNSSTLTIGNTGAASAGTYSIQIQGLSGVNMQMDNETLNLHTGPPQTIALLNPANGTPGIPLKPTLSWSSDPLPVNYTVEVSTDPTFTTVDQTQVATTPTATLGTALTPSTIYYWRVTAINNCGSTFSSLGFFQTVLKYASSPNVAIPDNNPTGVTDDLVVVSSDLIADLDVALKIDHNYVGDLLVSLEHIESGTTVIILDRPGAPASTFGSNGQNIDIILNDEATLVAEDDWTSGNPAYIAGVTYQPNNPLSAFDGEDLAGTWRLLVSDSASPDAGTLVSWSLCATPETIAAVSDSFERSQGTGMTLLQSQITGNDTPVNGGALSVTSVGPPASGNANVFMSGGFIFYQPMPGNVISDTFPVIVSEAGGGSTIYLVTVTTANDIGLSQNTVSMTVAGSTATLKYAGIPGRSYTFQFAENTLPTPLTWNSAGPIVCNPDGFFTVVHTIVYPSGELYRTTYP